MKRLPLILGFLLLFAPLGAGAEDEVHPVVVEAVMLESVGQKSRLGVRFHLQDGWHIYWKNPGEAGLPTEIDASLPVGVTLGEWQWPLPEFFESPGPIASYGYEHEVIIAAPLFMAEASEGPKKDIRMAVSWLTCKDRCILGSADLDLTLPLAPEAVLEAASFEASLARDKRERPFDASVEDLGEGKYRIVFGGVAPPKSVEWFPLPDENLLIDQVKVVDSDSGAAVTFRAEVLADLPNHELSSLVVVPRENHHREGWPLTLTLP